MIKVYDFIKWNYLSTVIKVNVGSTGYNEKFFVVSYKFLIEITTV